MDSSLAFRWRGRVAFSVDGRHTAKNDSMPRGMSREPRAAVLLVLAGTLVVCLVTFVASGQTPTPMAGDGRVVASDLRRGVIALEHGVIPGVGPAGTTEFQAEPPELVRGVSVDDVVHFTLQATEGSHGLLTLVALAPRRDALGPAFPRLGGSWVGPSLVGALAVLLAGVAALGYAGWHFARRLRAELRHAGRAQEALHKDVLAVTRALGEIAEALREKYLRDLRRRFDAVQSARATTPKSNGRHREEPAAANPGHLVVMSPESPTLVQTDELVRAFQEGLGGPEVVPIIRDERRGPAPGTWATLGLILVKSRGRLSRESLPPSAGPSTIGGEAGATHGRGSTDAG
ncbi:MAG: hypothetical protein DMD79_19800 [Candidatus Rokuibacteriota bacterium]|nr:MAG: hypothetical protein DMD79_19800 [Candidatus Rokubacteria bacterium]